MAKREKRERIDASTTSGATHNPFAAALAGLSAPERAAELVEAAPESSVAPPARLTPRTRVDRKGRGGKTVTLVEGLDGLTGAELEELARELRKALGTGAKVEEHTIVVQGDVGDRVKAWFADRGDSRV